ncbi:MAG: helix-hairpin-helix domain-containing protein [Sulfurovum sp.]|nr:helix-hairpin-helix domain-containing protein [Sulfurovum sp.]
MFKTLIVRVIVGMFLIGTMAFGMSLAKLNSASKSELMEINGVGEVKAADILKQRKKGKFKSFSDLTERVDGIGEQTAANIKGGVKNAEDVKKVVKKKTPKSKAKPKKDLKKKVTKKRKTTKEKVDVKKNKVKDKVKKKPRKLKKATEKEKELKKKSKKKKSKKKKIKKTKKTN